MDLSSALVLQEALVAHLLQPQPAYMGDLHVMPSIAWGKLEPNAYRQEDVTQAAAANATCNVSLAMDNLANVINERILFSEIHK